MVAASEPRHDPAVGLAELDDRPRPALRRSSLPGALRRGLVDFYYHSVRLVPANMAWGAVLLVLGWVALGVSLLAARVLSPAVGFPLVGIYRLAGHISRGDEVVLSDVMAAIRERFVPALVLAGGTSWATVLLLINVRAGLAFATPLGWAFATIAGWGLLGIVVYTVVLWPILADPDRRAQSARAAGRLAGYVAIGHLWRMLALSAVVVVIGAVSTIAFAAVLTISVAYLALVSCRIVLPEADTMADRLADRDAARQSG